MLYTKLYICGPWEKVVENGQEMKMGTHKDTKYDIYELSKVKNDLKNSNILPFVQGSIQESWPPRTTLQVPTSVVDEVIKLLGDDGYEVMKE